MQVDLNEIMKIVKAKRSGQSASVAKSFPKAGTPNIAPAAIKRRLRGVRNVGTAMGKYGDAWGQH